MRKGTFLEGVLFSLGRSDLTVGLDPRLGSVLTQFGAREAFCSGTSRRYGHIYCIWQGKRLLFPHLYDK